MIDVAVIPDSTGICVTAQTQRDLQKCQQRVNKNRCLFPRMKDHLQRFPKAELLKYANELSTQKQIPPADRICRRNRDALICWFCESCPEILSIVAAPVAPPPQRVLFPSISELLARLPDAHLCPISE
jgi:hypothetical protein